MVSVMRAFRNVSINRKLTLLMMFTVGVSLTLAGGAFVANDWVNFKKSLVEDLRSAAQVIGANSQAAVLFNDQKSGSETLSALQAQPSILAAAIYDGKGGVFAHYTRQGSPLPIDLSTAPMEGSYFYENHVDLFERIAFDGDEVGTILIRASLQSMQERMVRVVGIVTLVLIASIFIGYLLFSRLRSLITDPILELSDLARTITLEKDFSVRALRSSKDELGTLVSGFNEMLAELQTRDEQLENHRQHLEQEVTLRTAELLKSNKRLENEISERRQVQQIRQRYQDGLEKLDQWMRKLIGAAGKRQEFYDTVCEGIADLVNAELAVLPLMDDWGREYTYVAATGAGSDTLRGKVLPVQDGELEGWVARYRESLRMTAETGDDVAIPELMRSLNMSSTLVVPLLFSEKMVGALSAFREERAFDVVDEQVLNLFGQRVSTALANLELLIKLEEEKDRAEVTLQSIGDGVITTDGSGFVTFLNPIAERLTGWSSSDAQGLPVRKVFNIVNDVTGDPVENSVTRCLRDGDIAELSDHTILISRDGSRYAITDSSAPIQDRRGAIIGVVMVFHDVSKERDLKNQLTWQAAHDGLTGLVNRREFERRLDEVLARTSAEGGGHALLYLDLDQFKIVNDTCGHVAGDELLRQLAALLQQNVRSTDTLARLGGDEFGVLLECCPLDRARQVAEVLRRCINEFRFGWDNKTFEVGVSIGLVPLNTGCGAKGEVLSVADVACYAAKDLGRNRVHIYQPEDEEMARRHGEIRWVSRITEALNDHRLELYQQRIVPVSAPATDIVRYEVLVRMKDEAGNLVPPGAFIPAAERYNLMPAIDRWVIRNTFANYVQDTVYSINLSGSSLNDESLLDFIRDEFETSGVPHHAICFEVTETSAIANLSQASEFIHRLKDMGCQFALDDFGSGLSSFAYLKNLPVDYLKIDGQFVRGMIADSTDRAMVKSINEIGHVMGMRTIAEFVEGPAILAALHELGVDFAQGFGINKPHPMPRAGAIGVVNG